MSTSETLVLAAHKAAKVNWPALGWWVTCNTRTGGAPLWMVFAEMSALGATIALWSSGDELSASVEFKGGDELLLEPRGLRLSETPDELATEFVVALREGLADLLATSLSLCAGPPVAQRRAS